MTNLYELKGKEYTFCLCLALYISESVNLEILYTELLTFNFILSLNP